MMMLDQVCIEVAEFEPAARLTRRLGQVRTAAVLGDEPYVVVAAISEDRSDLSTLLREVESWVEDESLYAIRYLLDDRIYVLEAGAVDWDSREALRRESSLSV